MKIKKNSIYKVFAIILSVVLFITSVFLLVQIFTLNMLPVKLLVPISIVVLLLDLIFAVLLNFFLKGIASRAFFVLLTIIVGFTYSFGGFYLMKTSSMFNEVTNTSGKIKNTVAVLVLNDSNYDDLQDIENRTVGVLATIDSYGTNKSLDDIDEEGVSIEKNEFSSVKEMAIALYESKVDAVILNETYIPNVSEDSELDWDFQATTKIIHETVYYTEKGNTAKSVDDITEHAFNILISGNDTYGTLDTVSRSDVNMLLTVNPTTGTLLMTSIPRDYYVTTECEAQYGCQVGAMDKLTHTGVHGIETTQATLENLLGIDINYTFRVNFSSLVEIVDALGGIEVTVEPGYAVPNLLHGNGRGVTEGVNQLDGELALAYARERYAYEEGDRQRVKNQQQVLMGIIDKATSPAIITNYAGLMDALSGAFETNMSTQEIQKLVQFQLNNSPSWKFEQYSLDGAGSTEFCAELGNNAYVMIPDQNTVKLATKKIQAVIDGQSADSINSIESVQNDETTE